MMDMPGDDGHFVLGNRALLTFMQQRFLVSLLQVSDEVVRVSFPVSDFPVEGMFVNLEFHDATGYTTFETEVLEKPQIAGDGLLLRRPILSARMHHRMSWRVPADFHADLRHHVHPRHVDAPVINVSAGGVLVRTDAPFEAGDNVDVTLKLIDGKQQTFVGRVIHTRPADDLGGRPGRGHAAFVGIGFVEMAPELQQVLSAYIWRRVRDLHAQ